MSAEAMNMAAELYAKCKRAIYHQCYHQMENVDNKWMHF